MKPTRYDGDNGRHASNIYYTLMEACEWGWWGESLDDAIMAKAEMFGWQNDSASDSTNDSCDLPEWATMPIYDIDDDFDDCWF